MADQVFCLPSGRQLRLAAEMGMCSGLRIIMARAEKELERGPLAVYGEFVHNPAVYASLQQRGAQRVDAVREIPRGLPVLIGPHGNRSDLKEAVRCQGSRLVDASCRKVNDVVEAAGALNAAGRTVVFVGERHHEEARMVEERVPTIVVVDRATDAGDVRVSGPVGVLAQSTETVERFREVVRSLRLRYPDVVAVDTVCSETKRRQDAARALAREVDLAFVVGSPTSFNSRALVEACARHTTALLVTGPQDVVPEALTPDVTCIGMTAGASTPDDVVRSVVSRLVEVG